MCAALVCAHGLERTVDLTTLVVIGLESLHIHSFYRVLNLLPTNYNVFSHYFIFIPNLFFPFPYRVLNLLPTNYSVQCFPPHHFILIPNLIFSPFSSGRQRGPLGGGRRGRGRQQRPLLQPGRRVQPGWRRRSGRHGRRRGEPRRDGGDSRVRGVRVEGQQHRRGRGKRERCVDRVPAREHA